MKIPSIKITSLLLLFVSILSISCSKEDDDITGTKKFNKDEFTEYFICNADGKQFAVGNNASISTSITAFVMAGTLYISTSNGAFIPGSVASQEVIMQLKSFNKTTAKNYDLSGTYPAEVLKLNGTDDSYITNDGTMAVQASAVRVTKIEDGFMYGTFAFTAYDGIDKTKKIEVTNGEFKILVP